MNDRFEYLWNRLLHDRLGREELQELLAAEDLGETLHGMLEQGAFRGRLPPGREEELFQQVMQRARTGTVAAQELPKRRGLRRKLVTWWAAAAVLALLLLLLYQQRPRKTEPLAAKEIPAPLPGQATLTLADGRVLPVDSAIALQLKQGNVHITQQNGLLQYNAAAGATLSARNTLATPRGSQFRLLLPDGSRVWLNAASSLEYPVAFTGNDRTVTLSGQAYFEIAPDAKRPFFVKTGALDVQVLGTRFDVMAYPDESSINTTLLEGAVRVSAGGQSRNMRPGQCMKYGAGTHAFTLLPANEEETLAWKNGYFQFNEADIFTIMRQVARWYDVEVIYSGRLEEVQFSGLISRREQIGQLLHILEAAHQVRFKINGRQITVLPYQ